MNNAEHNLKHGQDANRSPKHEVHQPDGSVTNERVNVPSNPDEK